MIAGSTTLGFADFWLSAWGNRRGLARFGAAIAILAAAMCLLAWVVKIPIDFGALAAGIVGGLVVVVLVAAVRVFFFMRRLRDEQRDISIEADDAGIVTRDRAGATVTIPWGVVIGARETQRAVVLTTVPSGIRYLPKRAFAGDAFTALRALIVEKLGDKAKLRPV